MAQEEMPSVAVMHGRTVAPIEYDLADSKRYANLRADVICGVDKAL